MNNGRRIPAIGLGVFQSREGAETRAAVECALANGYRHIDTAHIYGNERSVGDAIRASGIDRGEIFVTTKLWNTDHGYDAARRACETSLRALGLDHLDLYLIHWPVAQLRLESWRALEDMVDEGMIRSIGVSNYMVRHLDELAAHARRLPTVNQIELSPYNYRRRIHEIAWCHEHGVVVEAYSPLTKGRRLANPPLVAIAARYERTTAQILIRWALEKRCLPLPKSVTPARIIANARVFDFTIDPADMAALDALNEDLATGWDPTDAE